MGCGIVAAQDVHLSTIGTLTPGFRIDGSDIYDYSGCPLSGARDVNIVPPPLLGDGDVDNDSDVDIDDANALREFWSTARRCRD